MKINLLLTFLFACLVNIGFSQSIIINEVSQGPSGAQEYIEILITGTPSCTNPQPSMDLRGFIFDDNNRYFTPGVGTGTGVAQGACRFATTAIWANVPIGTLIVIYNDNDPNPALPPDDLDPLDGNCTLIIPISSIMFEKQTSQPNFADSTYATTGWTPGGSWGPISMANGNDSFQIYDPTNMSTPLHSVSWGNNTSNTTIYFSGSAGGKVFYMDNTVDNNFSGQANWVSASASIPGSETPGAYNSQSNADWIFSINQNCGSLPLSIVQLNDTIQCVSGNSFTYTSAGSTSPNYTYSWDIDGNGTTDYTTLNVSAQSYTMTGAYDVILTVSNGICNSVDTLTATLSGHTISTSITSVSCFGGTNGTASVTASGGNTPYTYLWSTSSTQSSISGLSSGLYTVSVTEASILGSTTVTTLFTEDFESGSANWQLASTNLGATIVGDNFWTVNNSYAGGQIFFGFVTVPSTANQPAGIAGFPQSNYLHILSNQAQTDGVSNTNFFAFGPEKYFAELTSPISTIGKTNVTIDFWWLCEGDASTRGETYYSIDGGTTWLAYGANLSFSSVWQLASNTNATWDNVADLRFGFLFNNQATGNDPAFAVDQIKVTGTVTGSSSVGCVAIETVTITEPTPLSVTASCSPISVIAASDGAVTAITTGGTTGYTYLWSNGQTNTSISGLAVGNYTVTTTDTKGCIAISSCNVTTPTCNITATISATNILCNGGTGNASANLIGSTSTSFTYLWNNTLTTQTISGLSVANYSVTITDGFGCTDFATATITEPTALTVTMANTNISCAGYSTGIAVVNTQGGATGYTYLWSNGATTASISGLPQGTYTNTITDGNLCTVISAATITEPSTLSLTIACTSITAAGASDGTSTSSITGGITNYSYFWNNGATTTNITGVSAGNVSLTVTDANGCTVINGCTIMDVVCTATPSITTTNVSCFGNSTGSTTANLTGGGTSFSYLWTSGQTSQTSTGISAGTQFVTITDNTGCNYTTSTTITEPSAISISTTVTNVLCNGTSTGNSSLTVQGGTTGYTYLWGNGNTTSSASGLAQGIYAVTVLDANLCNVVSSITITEPTPLILSILCTSVSTVGGSDGSSLSTVSGGTTSYSYLWSNGVTTQNTTGLLAGNHALTLTDANNCTITDACTVIEPINCNLTVTATSTNVSCFGGNDGSSISSVAGGTSPFTYLWSNNNTSANIIGVAKGNYTIIVTDATACIDSVSIVITEPSAVSADFSFILDGDYAPATTTFTNESIGASVYTWDFGNGNTDTATNPTNLYETNGEFQVLLTAYSDATMNCSDTITKTVTILSQIVIPNAFSPDGDGYNDLFVIKGLDSFTNNKIFIYNRWGDLVYSAAPYNNDWNGSSNSSDKQVVDGTYFFVLEIDNKPYYNGYLVKKSK